MISMNIYVQNMSILCLIALELHSKVNCSCEKLLIWALTLMASQGETGVPTIMKFFV